MDTDEKLLRPHRGFPSSSVFIRVHPWLRFSLDRYLVSALSQPAYLCTSGDSSARTEASLGSSARFFNSSGSAVSSNNIAPPFPPSNSVYRQRSVRTPTPVYVFPSSLQIV